MNPDLVWRFALLRLFRKTKARCRLPGLFQSPNLPPNGVIWPFPSAIGRTPLARGCNHPWLPLSFRDWAGNTTNFPREITETALAHVIGDRDCLHIGLRLPLVI